MKIGSFSLEQDVLVVAEIGNNHEGRFDIAQEMVRRAAECGVHAVKFQTFQTRLFVNPRDKARYDRLKSFELSYAQFEDLRSLAKSLGLLFLSTPLDLESARFLNGLVDAFKIASGDNNFFPLIEFVCGTDKPLIVSTGASDMDQVRTTLDFIRRSYVKSGTGRDAVLLHCVSSYPAPPEDVHLSVIPRLAQELGCPVGYSDHTLGIDACIAAAILGARVIEKHFTLDKRFSDFRDHALSADPEDMKLLVRRIAEVRTLLGTPVKRVQKSEEPSVSLIRRSIAAARDLPRGHKLSWTDLVWLRPAVGVEPGRESLLVGKSLKRDLSSGEPIQFQDIE